MVFVILLKKTPKAAGFTGDGVLKIESPILGNNHKFSRPTVRIKKNKTYGHTSRTRILGPTRLSRTL